MDEPMHAVDSGESGTHFGGLISAAAAAAAVTSPQYNNIYIRGRETHISPPNPIWLQREAQRAKKMCVGGSAWGRGACRCWLNALAGLMEQRLWRTGRPDKLTRPPHPLHAACGRWLLQTFTAASCENVCRITPSFFPFLFIIRYIRVLRIN